MESIPQKLFYTKTHEWLRQESDGSLAVGITDFAQQSLGDLVFVELPTVGDSITQGSECGVLESVKAAADLYAPLNGTIVAINEDLNASPQLINEQPYEGGWLFKLMPTSSDDTSSLLDAKAYATELNQHQD